MENQKQPQMKNFIDLLASLDQDFVNCFYSVNVQISEIRLQGTFDKFAEMSSIYTFPVQHKRTIDNGTQFFEGTLKINGVNIEIVLTH